MSPGTSDVSGLLAGMTVAAVARTLSRVMRRPTTPWSARHCRRKAWAWGWLVWPCARHPSVQVCPSAVETEGAKVAGGISVPGPCPVPALPSPFPPPPGQPASSMSSAAAPIDRPMPRGPARVLVENRHRCISSAIAATCAVQLRRSAFCGSSCASGRPSSMLKW